MTDPHDHWESLYRSKRPEEVSWYRPHLEISLELVRRAAPQPDAHLIDVGAGASTLVDDLIGLGYRNLCALDISAAALEVSRARLGVRARQAQWLVGDVRTVGLGAQRFDVWHDRAVFHFLTNAADRAAYVRQATRALRPGGHLVVACFGPEGPNRCSGLDVVRYDGEGLQRELGSAFRLIEQRTELHRTPGGVMQQFTYCCCRMV